MPMSELRSLQTVEDPSGRDKMSMRGRVEAPQRARDYVQRRREGIRDHPSWAVVSGAGHKACSGRRAHG